MFAKWLNGEKSVVGECHRFLIYISGNQPEFIIFAISPLLGDTWAKTFEARKTTQMRCRFVGSSPKEIQDSRPLRRKTWKAKTIGARAEHRQATASANGSLGWEP